MLSQQWPLAGFRDGHCVNTTADAVSRLPLPLTRESRPPKVLHLIEYLDALPVNSLQICLWTDQDPVLAKVNSSHWMAGKVPGGDSTYIL